MTKSTTLGTERLLTLIIVSLLLTLFPSSLLASRFRCGHVFKRNHAVFLFQNKDLAYNRVPMTLNLNSFSDETKGVLYFNMCEEIQLLGACGPRATVGQFIFVKDEASSGESKCLVFEPRDNKSWEFALVDGIKADMDDEVSEIEGESQNRRDVSLVGQSQNVIAEITPRSIRKSNTVVLQGVRVFNRFSQISETAILANEEIELLKEPSTVFNQISIIPHQFHSEESLSNSENDDVILKSIFKNEQIEGNNQTENIFRQKNSLSLNVEDISNSSTNNSKTNKLISNRILTLDSSESNFGKVNKNSFYGTWANTNTFRILTKQDDKLNQINASSIEIGSVTSNKTEKRFVELIKQQNKSDQDHLSSDYTLDLRFYCSDEKPHIKPVYDAESQTLQIQVYSNDGCVTKFSLLSLLDQIWIGTAIVFLIIGLSLVGTGLWMFKSARWLLGILSWVILLFWLHLEFVEGISSFLVKMFLVALVALVVSALATSMFLFSVAIDFTLLAAATLTLALVAKSVLETHYTFFESPYSELMLTLSPIIIFLVLKYFSPNMFALMTTSAAGAFLCVASIRYFGISDYDFLMDSLLQKWTYFAHPNADAWKFAMVFLLVWCLGMLIQFLLFRKKSEKQVSHEIDMLNETGKEFDLKIDDI